MLRRRGQCSAVQRDFVAPPTLLRGVTQFQHNDLFSHDVELVATWWPPGNDFHTSPVELPIRPQANTGQSVERGVPTPVADHPMAPTVAAHCRDIPHYRRSPALAQLPQPIKQSDDGNSQHGDEHDHGNQERAHRPQAR
jgi:hypothetical protein